MITYYSKTVAGTLLEVDAIRSGVWVHAVDPTPEEVISLAENLRLDESLITDALDIYEVPRLEIEDGVLYIFTRYVHKVKDTIETTPLLLTYTPRRITTISLHTFPMTLLKNRKGWATNRPLWLLLVLLSVVNQTYASHIHLISRKVRALRVQVEKISNKDLLSFIDVENTLYDISSALVHAETLSAQLSAGKIVTLTEEQKDLAEDMLLETRQLIEIVRVSIRTIINVREASSAIMTNTLNQVIKLFTSLTVLLSVPMLVVSAYGMNIGLPLQHSPYAFAIIIGSTIGVVIALLLIFIKKDWL